MVDDFWYSFIQNLLLAFAPVLASLAAGALFALVRKLWAQFKNEQPNISEWLEQAATMAVLAAEQAGAAGYIQDKKEYALRIAQEFLDARGIKLNVDLISAAIEAAVMAEFNKYRDEDKQSAAGFALPASEPE